LLLYLGAVSCRHGVAPSVHPEIATQGRADSLVELTDSRASYRRAGLLVAAGELSFVGSISFLGGGSTDSTLMLIDLSLSDRQLTFTREGDSYHAGYEVDLALERAGSATRRITTHEQVRVGSLRETTRDEESVIYQQVASLPPGEATVTISIRDAGSTRNGIVRDPVRVPRFDEGTITAPIPALRARPRSSREKLPEIVVNPRATSVYGHDSVAVYYLEGYGPPMNGWTPVVQVRVISDNGVVVYADSVPWIEAGDKLRSAILRVPIARVGFGELSVSASPFRGPGASALTLQAPLLVSFGDGLPISSFGDMLGLLRFFASADRLRTLRELAPGDRPRGWAAFLEATDSATMSPANAALKAYLARLVDANARFREDDHTPGWLTDRGMIFSALGEPDNQIEPNASDAERSLAQVWSYHRYHVRFTFVDRAGFGRWRLTAGSEAEYRALMHRIAR
jgi:GWxTD domain-containing protein